jgi:hypothetical protein
LNLVKILMNHMNRQVSGELRALSLIWPV